MSVYTVKSGDTLSGIANRFNVKGGYMTLAKYNNIANPNIICVGQKIKIPSETSATSKPAEEKKQQAATKPKTDTNASSGKAGNKAAEEQKATDSTYVVKSGDTLSGIANRFKVSGGYKALAAYNNISNPNIISVGQVLRIPGGNKGGTKKPAETPVEKVPASSGWTWPSTATYISSKFGPRGALALTNGKTSSNFHRGVDIAGGGSATIKAAKAGTARAMSFDTYGYGNWIQIDHHDGTYTRYAHMKSFAVTNAEVSAGQTIGYEGATGGVTGPHLHFEVRVGGTAKENAVDPLKYVSP